MLNEVFISTKALSAGKQNRREQTWRYVLRSTSKRLLMDQGGVLHLCKEQCSNDLKLLFELVHFLKQEALAFPLKGIIVIQQYKLN